MEIFGKKISRPSWVPKWMSISFVIAFIFLVSMFFLGPNNYMKVASYKKQIKELKTEIQANRDSASIYETKTRELHSDKVTLERIAREKYGMKRSNEEVYITEIP